MREDRDLEKFLEDAPWMRRWLHQCTVCRQQGYKPEMEKSESYTSPVGSKLSRLVSKMTLNDTGVCEECRNISGHLD
jgi:hypothetical protein